MNIPCINCITLAMCISRYKRAYEIRNVSVNSLSFHWGLKALKDHCSLFDKYDHAKPDQDYSIVNNQILNFWGSYSNKQPRLTIQGTKL